MGKTSNSLGIDIGSTSTKVAIVDQSGRVVADVYRKTAGAPLLATKLIFKAMREVAGRCGIPSTAISVAANVTVVNPTLTGTLSFFAGGPIVSRMKEVPVTAGKTRALNVDRTLGTDGSLSVCAALPQGGSTHVLRGVSGWFE